MLSVDSYARISDRKYPGYSLSREVRHCLKRMMDVLAHHQQQAYAIFKMWPSLVIGAILRDIEQAPDFISTITDDLSHTLKMTSFFLQETGTIQSPTHAMPGLWKTMGHPIVDMNLSASSWMKKGMVMKRELEPAALSINNMFKKEYCRQFNKTHKNGLMYH